MNHGVLGWSPTAGQLSVINISNMKHYVSFNVSKVFEVVGMERQASGRQVLKENSRAAV